MATNDCLSFTSSLFRLYLYSLPSHALSNSNVSLRLLLIWLMVIRLVVIAYCFPNSNKRHQSLRDVCSEINGDASLYSLFRCELLLFIFYFSCSALFLAEKAIEGRARFSVLVVFSALT